jgi:hypothetical protein
MPRASMSLATEKQSNIFLRKALNRPSTH